MLGDDGIKILLLLDGFDKPLAEDRLTRNLWDQLRELGSLGNLRYVTTSRKPLRHLIRSEESATSDFWNIFDQSPVRVETFDDADLNAVVGQLPFELDGGACTALKNWSGHFPPLLLGLLNAACNVCGVGRAGAAQINAAAETELPAIDNALAMLWADCAVPTQDRYRDLCTRGEQSRAEFGREHLGRLGECGFVRRAGNKVLPSCRLLQRHLERNQSSAGGMARLFGTPGAYAAYMREVLERRLGQLQSVDAPLLRLVQRAIEDIPDFPDDCLNSLSNIQELALDAIWSQEDDLGSDRRLPQGWWDQWTCWGSRNGTVARLRDYAGRRIPGERALQVGMLELVTGSRARFDPIARFATKDM